MRYFCLTGIDNYFRQLRGFLKKSKNQTHDFTNLLINAANANAKSVKVIINKPEIIDTLSEETLRNLKDTAPIFRANWKLSESELNESYLYQKVMDF